MRGRGETDHDRHGAMILTERSGRENMPIRLEKVSFRKRASLVLPAPNGGMGKGKTLIGGGGFP